ncbi:MAG: TonB-dependent receptor, partial [Dokdonella sp.]
MRRHGAADPRRGSGACLLALTGMLAGSATAASWLPSVGVTATRSAQDAFEVPAAISLLQLDTTDADRLGINLSEVTAAVPGLLVRNRQNLAQDEQISIRGFGAR